MSYEYGGDLDINTIFLIIDHPFCLNFNQAQINQSFFLATVIFHIRVHNIFSVPSALIAFIEWGQSNLEFAKKLL